MQVLRGGFYWNLGPGGTAWRLLSARGRPAIVRSVRAAAPPTIHLYDLQSRGLHAQGDAMGLKEMWLPRRLITFVA